MTKYKMNYQIVDHLEPAEREQIKQRGLHVYGIRHDDDGEGIPVTIEPFVVVNRYGFLVTDEEINFPGPVDNNGHDWTYLDFDHFIKNAGEEREDLID